MAITFTEFASGFPTDKQREGRFVRQIPLIRGDSDVGKTLGANRSDHVVPLDPAVDIVHAAAEGLVAPVA